MDLNDNIYIDYYLRQNKEEAMPEHDRKLYSFIEKLRDGSAFINPERSKPKNDTNTDPNVYA